MKHLRLICLLLLACLLLPAAPAGADSACATGEEFAARLSAARAAGQARVEIRCQSALFRAIQASGFALLDLYELQGGVAAAEVRYTQDGTFIFSDVVYGETPWTQCADEAELGAAMRAYAAAGTRAFALVVPPDLCQALYENGRMSAYAAQAGIEDAGLRFVPAAGIIRLSDAVFTELPLAVAADEQEFVAAIAAFAEAGATEFRVAFDPDFFAALREDPERKRLMQAMSRLLSYSSAESPTACTIEYTGVAFSDAPRLLCGAAEDVAAVIRAMGSAGLDRFDLVLTADLYAELAAEDFRPLHALEADAGLTFARMSYNPTTRILFYREAAITADAVRLDAVNEAADYVTARAATGAGEIHLFCTERLYRRLLEGVAVEDGEGGRLVPVYDLAARAGLFDFTVYYSDETHIISFDVSARYPGAVIVSALRRNDAASLTPREREAWRAAADLAAAAAADTPRETARRIHDALCAAVVYVDDDSQEEDDTAVGALLNGAANCDGYADAFYLCASLAGLNVRCQRGGSYEDAAAGERAVAHMWNLIELDGTWRMVDVTWDDGADGWTHLWFDVGYDRASRAHLWNEDLSVPLRPDTDLARRPVDEFSVRDLAEALAAVDVAAAARLPEYAIVFDREVPADVPSRVVEAVSRSVVRAFTYTWNERMRALTIRAAAY